MTVGGVECQLQLRPATARESAAPLPAPSDAMRDVARELAVHVSTLARVDAGLALSAAIAASNSTAYGFRAMSVAYAVQADIPTSCRRARPGCEIGSKTGARSDATSPVMAAFWRRAATSASPSPSTAWRAPEWRRGPR